MVKMKLVLILCISFFLTIHAAAEERVCLKIIEIDSANADYVVLIGTNDCNEEICFLRDRCSEGLPEIIVVGELLCDSVMRAYRIRNDTVVVRLPSCSSSKWVMSYFQGRPAYMPKKCLELDFYQVPRRKYTYEDYKKYKDSIW